MLELTPEQTQKLEQVRAMLSHQNPGLEFEGLLEKLCDEFLKRKMLKGTEPHCTAEPQQRSDSLLRRSRSQNPRQIALTTRKVLFQNAKYQCEHIHPQTQTRCPETRFLEIDHLQPVAHGGTNAFQNLRVLCRSHNQARTKERAR